MINPSMNSQMHNRALQAAIQNAFLTDPMAALQALNSLDRAMGAGQNFPGGRAAAAGTCQPIQGGQRPSRRATVSRFRAVKDRNRSMDPRTSKVPTATRAAAASSPSMHPAGMTSTRTPRRRRSRHSAGS